MRGDRQHPVVVLGRHGLDHAAGGAPQAGDHAHRLRIGVLDRRQDAVASFEQGGERGLGPGMLRARDRMRGDEPAGLGQMGHHGPDHLGLDRPDVADDGVPLEPRRHGFRHRAARADRGAEHDEVGAGDRLARHRRRAIGEAQRSGLGERLLGAGAGDDLVGQARAAQHQGERAVDQADADQRHPAKMRSLRVRAHAMNSWSARIAARFSSSRPTDRRRHPGSP